MVGTIARLINAVRFRGWESGRCRAHGRHARYTVSTRPRTSGGGAGFRMATA